MLRRIWAAAAAGGLMLAGTAPAAEEAVHLGRFKPSTSGFSGSTSAATKPASDDSDTMLTAHHGGGFHGGGFHGGYHGGYHGGFYGGYRGYYGGGYYRPYYGGFYGGYYRPYSSFYFGLGYPGYYGGYGYGYGGYYRPYYMSSYYATPSYYAAPSYSYYSGSICSLGTPATVTTVPTISNSLPVPQPVPATIPRSSDGTFPYDGGPTNPVPLPAPSPVSSLDDSSTVRTVLTTKAKSSYRYTAYGEKR